MSLIPRFCAAFLLLALAGCGKPGSPIPPPGSPYPRFYPNPTSTVVAPTPDSNPKPDATVPPPGEKSGKPNLTEKGAYIDPSVRATELTAPSIVQPGSNLPYSRPVTTDPMGQGMGAPNFSPLAPVEGTAPPSGSGPSGNNQ